MSMSVSVEKNKNGGVSLDPTRSRVKDYIKDMDARNRKVDEGKKRDLSNRTEALLSEHTNGIFGVTSFGIPSKTPYFDYDQYMKNNTPWRKSWQKLKRKMERLFS